MVVLSFQAINLPSISHCCHQRIKQFPNSNTGVVRCAIAEASGQPAPMGRKTKYNDGLFEKAFMTLFARKMEKFARSDGTDEKKKGWFDYDYDSFVEVSKRVMLGRNRLQQQQVVREVLLSMLPPGAPDQFRKLFPPTKWAAEFNAALTVPFFHCFLMASIHSHVQTKEFHESGNEGEGGSIPHNSKYNGDIRKLFPVNETHTGSPESTRSYGDTQLEIFHHRHGLLVLHLLAALMFVPSLVAWLQRISIGPSFPCFWDSVLCIGVLLHGLCDSKPEFNFYLFPIPGIPSWEFRLSFAYLLAGYFSYLSALALAPYQVFYAMAGIGAVSFAFRIIQRKNRKNGENYHRTRKHSHRH